MISWISYFRINITFISPDFQVYWSRRRSFGWECETPILSLRVRRWRSFGWDSNTEFPCQKVAVLLVRSLYWVLVSEGSGPWVRLQYWVPVSEGGGPLLRLQYWLTVSEGGGPLGETPILSSHVRRWLSFAQTPILSSRVRRWRSLGWDSNTEFPCQKVVVLLVWIQNWVTVSEGGGPMDESSILSYWVI